MPRLLTILIASALVLAACQTATPAAGDDEASRLFSQTAAGGRFEPATGEGAYTLMLTGVDADTIQFADRPSRSASVIPLADFVAHWDATFGDDPPNAALVEHERSGDADTVVVTLSPPTYDAGTGDLQFNVTVLAGEAVPERLVRIARQVHDQPPASFSAVSLFIDSGGGGPGVINGCAIQSYTICPEVDLSGQDLAGANLYGANLASSNLSNTNLSNANLGGADLIWTNLTGTNLNGADLGGAGTAYATFCNTTLPNGQVDSSGC